jgi:hypothetical protein
MKNIDVTIDNFGKIQHAQFQVKPFTVIAGKNASGKSFITRALYSVFNTLNKDHLSIELDERIYVIHNLVKFMYSYCDESNVKVQNHLLDAELTIGNLIKNCELIFHQNALSMQIDYAHIFHDQIRPLSDLFKALNNDISGINKYNELMLSVNQVLNYLNLLAKLLKEPSVSLNQSLEGAMEQSLIGNFQVNATSKLKNANASTTGGVHINFGDDIGNLVIEPKGVQSRFQTKGIDEFQQIDNVVYLESPIYWKIKDVLKGWVTTQKDPSLRRQRKHQQKELKKIPQYILDTFDLLGADVIQDEIHEDLVKLKQKINKCIGGQIQISQSGDLQFISQNQKGESFGVDLNQTASGTTSLGLISLLLDKNVIVPNSVLSR